MKARLDFGDIKYYCELFVLGSEGGKHPRGLAVVGDAAREMDGSGTGGRCAFVCDQARDSRRGSAHHSGTSQHGSRMSRAVEILTLRQFEAAGGLADGYAFEDFSCPLNEEIEKFLRQPTTGGPGS